MAPSAGRNVPRPCPRSRSPLPPGRLSPGGRAQGGAVVLGALAASASYIATPAATRLALPEANAACSLGAALALTFSFNIVIGIQLHPAMAEVIDG
ncbi:sodium-dependent bicarbonate transport family permease [Azorhizobium caulinodans]|uniref:sodium-dependent bicarbonate transport family permease n=1 Tax=Azorhizobium caulinodans TaxID=7 RepID=UPI002FBEA245